MASDVDQLVQQITAWLTTVTRRAGRIARAVLVVVAIVSITSFSIGLAALDGGMRTVWIVLGAAFGIVAVGAVVVAWWRVSSIRRHVPEIAGDVRTMLSDTTDHSRTVIESIVIDRDGDGDRDRPNSGTALVVGREMFQFREVIGTGAETSARLTAVMTAVTSFPVLLVVGFLIAVVFAFLLVIFLFALALG